MRIGIIDSDNAFTESFIPQLRGCMEAVGIADTQFDVYADPASFLNRPYQKGEYFLLILDLYQPDTNGIAVAEKIREWDEEIPLVFVSSINEYATETYLVDAAYLILKPIDSDGCFKILNRVLHRLCPQSWELLLPENYRCQIIDIVYVKQEQERYHFYLKEDEHIVPRLGEDLMEKMMRVYRCFYRVTSDVMVNMAHITSIEDSGIVLNETYTINMTKEQIEGLRVHISRVKTEMELNELCRI